MHALDTIAIILPNLLLNNNRAMVPPNFTENILPFQPSQQQINAEGQLDGSQDFQDCELDSSLWSRLPEDLLLNIFARLPLNSLARHQLVCRAWKTLLQNRSFLRLRLGKAPPNSWFIFQRKSQPLTSVMSVDCYNTHTNRWHEFRFDHLPQIQRVCATAGSLFLCVGKIGCGRLPSKQQTLAPGQVEAPSYKFLDMVVCNPLRNNSWEHIPERFGSFVPQVGIVAEPHSEKYKVIFASPEKTEIYDSCTRSWRMSSETLSPSHDTCSSMVEYHGKLLFLGVGSDGQGKVFVYNLDSNKCTSFGNPYSRDPFPRFGFLENCGGRLLMVRVTVSPDEMMRSREVHYSQAIRFERNFQLRVCEYVHSEADDDFTGGVWQELLSIPLLDLESAVSVHSKRGNRFLEIASFSTRSDLLCFTMGMTNGKLDWTNCVAGRAVFLYSLSQNSWCFVGERPDWSHDGVICMRSLQFQPSIHAALDP